MCRGPPRGTMSAMGRSTSDGVDEALEQLAAGACVVVAHDDQGPGLVAVAAERCGPEARAFLARHGDGAMRLALPPEQHAALGLGLITAEVRPGGVLERAGRTEAAVDLVRLAGLAPAAVVTEVPDPVHLAARHRLARVGVGAVIARRRQTETLVERVVETVMPTTYGTFTAIGYREVADGAEHLAMVKGDLTGREDVLVRVHTGCTWGDALQSGLCDCAGKLDDAMRRVEEEGAGVVLYLERRSLDCATPEGPVGLPVELRNFGIGAQVLADLGLTTIRLLTNFPKRITGLDAFGLSISAQLPVGRQAGLQRAAAQTRPTLGLDLDLEDVA
jgi:GTP cyclohydrolase II/3,4-dihydroxy-2-butanone 4-phosphate synthase